MVSERGFSSPWGIRWAVKSKAVGLAERRGRLEELPVAADADRSPKILSYHFLKRMGAGLARYRTDTARDGAFIALINDFC